MTPKDQSKYPYDRSEYVVMPPIHKAEDGTLTTEPQNVDDWIKAEAAKDYEGLLVQFRSMKCLLNSQGERLSWYANRDYSLSERRLNELTSSLESEREIQLLQKVQQLEDQVSCLVQNSESQTQTQIALIKKLEKAKWRPIESAPMDGTRIITCCMSPSEYTSVKAGFMAINGYDEDLASWPLHNKHHFPATHWMPLPEPPTTEETK